MFENIRTLSRWIENQRPQDKINVNSMMIGALPSCRALFIAEQQGSEAPARNL
jgi:hypothetical protein